MSQLSLAAMAIALIAVIAMLFGLPDPWFFGLLSFACLMASADAAYREVKLWGALLLATAAACAVAAVATALRDAHTRHTGGST
ncbi:hypothetical protein [Streptomyces sp. NPDC054940]